MGFSFKQLYRDARDSWDWDPRNHVATASKFAQARARTEVKEQIKKHPEIEEAIKSGKIRDPWADLKANAPENEKIRNQTRFQEQCFLVDNMDQLVKKGIEFSYRSHLKYKNFIMLNGNPAEVSHLIAAKYNIQKLMKLTPAQTALLKPYVRIYKVVYDKNGKTSNELELFFKGFISSSTIENLTKRNNFKGEDAGLKEISYETSMAPNSTIPLTEFNFKFFFGNLNSLFAGTGDKEKATFLDLIIPDVAKSKGKSQNTNPHEFRIKLVLGWSIPQDPDRELFDQDTIKALECSKTIFLLNLKDHDISFNEDGSAELNASYVHAVSSILSNRLADVFIPTWFSKEATKIKQFLTKYKEATQPVEAKKPDVKKKPDKPDIKGTAKSQISSIGTEEEAGSVNLSYTDVIYGDTNAGEKVKEFIIRKRIQNLRHETNKKNTPEY